jgi:hypothetical protein
MVTAFAGVQELQVITPCNGATGELRLATTPTKAERHFSLESFTNIGKRVMYAASREFRSCG